MRNYKETIEDKINAALDATPTDELVSVWNEYCNKANYMDDYIYYNTPMFFEENYHEGSLYDLVKDIFYGKYVVADHYIKWSQQTGHLDSFDYLSDANSPYDQSSLVDWLIRTYGDDLESIGDFIGVDLTEDEDTDYTVGDRTYRFVRDAETPHSCDKCCFNRGKCCAASDLYDIGALPQCDEDGMGYNGYWIEVKD